MHPVVIPRDFTTALAMMIQQNTPGKEPVQREKKMIVKMQKGVLPCMEDDGVGIRKFPLDVDAPTGIQGEVGLTVTIGPEVHMALA